jgi:putative PIN family toxin of toxin-antitoxin system
MRVVLDTSVLVAAARSNTGASQRQLRLLPDPRFKPVISVALLMEYTSVLTTREHLSGRTSQDVEAFLNYLVSVSHLQSIHFRLRPQLVDPDDDLVLELAVAAECRWIITYNRDDFHNARRFGVEPIEPASFLRLIGELP